MAYTFIQGNQAHTSGPNGEITRIVMHATVSPCTMGGARGNARYFQSAGAGGLAHFVVDPGEVIQCCQEDIACWHAPPNKGSIGVELCDPQSGPDNRWSDANHVAMLQLAAKLVRDLCTRHNVPMQFVDAAGLKAGHKGITMHRTVVEAFHQSDHTDPGTAFPMDYFIALVNKGASAPTQEDDVTPQDKADIIQGVYDKIHADLKVLLHGDPNHAASLESLKAALDKIAAKVGA